MTNIVESSLNYDLIADIAFSDIYVCSTSIENELDMSSVLAIPSILRKTIFRRTMLRTIMQMRLRRPKRLTPEHIKNTEKYKINRAKNNAVAARNREMKRQQTKFNITYMPSIPLQISKQIKEARMKPKYLHVLNLCNAELYKEREALKQQLDSLQKLLSSVTPNIL